MKCLFCKVVAKKIKLDDKLHLVKISCPHCGNYTITYDCLNDRLGFFYEGIILKKNNSFPLSDAKLDNIMKKFANNLSSRGSKSDTASIDRSNFDDFIK